MRRLLATSYGSRRPTYTDATLKRAVAEGIDPQGAHLGVNLTPCSR